MRKIEEKMVRAIRRKEYFRQDNTGVSIYNSYIVVYLHSNRIARVYKNNVELSSCGWHTVTTKSRLNAILSMYGFYVYQKNFAWYIHNVKNVNCRTGDDIEFYDGITLSI